MMAALSENPIFYIPWITGFAFNNPEISASLEFSKNIGSSASISNATNATPIRVTANSHGLPVGVSMVDITGVVGNEAANGFHIASYVDANTFDLTNTAGSGTYVSGGTVQRIIRARGRSLCLGMIRIGREGMPWNFCSSSGSPKLGGGASVIY